MLIFCFSRNFLFYSLIDFHKNLTFILKIKISHTSIYNAASRPTSEATRSVFLLKNRQKIKSAGNPLFVTNFPGRKTMRVVNLI